MSELEELQNLRHYTAQRLKDLDQQILALSPPAASPRVEVDKADDGKWFVYMPCGEEIAICHSEEHARWIADQWNTCVAPAPDPDLPKQAPVDGGTATDDDFTHAEDCDCFGDCTADGTPVEHSKDCKNCTCQRCDRPPVGWECTRSRGHDGPCAAVPAAPPVDTRPDPRVEEIRRKVDEELMYSSLADDCRYLLSEFDRLRKGER